MGRVLVLALAFLAACAPLPPASPVAPPRARARARVARGSDARAPDGAPPLVVAALRSDPAAERARLGGTALASAVTAALGAPVSSADLKVTLAGDEWTLQAEGEGPESALARCAALVRVVERPLHKERGAALEWLVGERARALGALRALEGSLLRMPVDTALHALPRSWDEALTLARIRALEARAASAEDARALPLLAALQRMVVQAVSRRAELVAEGLGDAHPELAGASALVEALRARRDQALLVEREAARDWLAKVEVLAKARRGDARAALRAALRERVAALAPTSVASADPFSLRLLALEHAAEDASLAALAAREGPRHPERAAAELGKAMLDARFEEERKLILASIDVELGELALGGSPHAEDPGPGDERPAALAREQLALAATLERLAWWEDALASPSPARVTAPCALAR